MARVTLFDQASISPYSRFFWLENQVTVVGHGLQPDDYITFEAVETNAAPMAKNCGCDFVPAGAISLNSILELTCAACNGVVSPVVLTAANPVVVLDHPQGFYLRAVYHGTGLSTGEVIVRATDTETRDLTDALRGCPERCPDYVGTLCITPGTRAFGVNDPRDPEATVPIMREGNTVGYIYPTPRSHAPVPVTEDPCQPCDGNTVGAIIGYAMPWDGPETECLCLCYECQDVSWEQVGDAFCRNNTLWVNEISNCGRTRERDTGDACCVDTTWTQVGAPECRNDGLWWVNEESNCGNTRERNTGIPCGDVPCVPDWTDVGVPYCIGTACVQDQKDGCGNTRTVPTSPDYCWPPCYEPCVPDWTNAGEPYCDGGNCMQDQVDSCGNFRTVTSTGCWPECGPCVPDWTNAGEPYCDGGNCMQDQVDGCGNTRTVASTDCSPACEEPCVPDWTNAGEPYCDGDNCMQDQVDGCGNIRTVEGTGCSPACEEPCVPGAWEDVPGATRCVGTQPQQQQTNGCEFRWVDTPHVWEDTGNRRCEGGFYQRQEMNACGLVRWVDIGPIQWENVGEPFCDGSNCLQNQKDDCGNTRTISSTECDPPCYAPIEQAPGNSLNCTVRYQWDYPCDPENPDPQSLSCGGTLALVGGSGSFTYSWSHTPHTGNVEFSGAGPSYSVADMFTRTCPYIGAATGTVSVTVTDTVTGNTATFSGGYVLSYET